MTRADERIQVLKMVESGQITAEEGVKLLEAMESASVKEQAEPNAGQARWFRVHVSDVRTGASKVHVNIPMGLVNVGMRMGARFAPDMVGVNIEEVIQAVKQGFHGRILDVQDDEQGERVEIYVE